MLLELLPEPALHQRPTPLIALWSIRLDFDVCIESIEGVVGVVEWEAEKFLI